MLTPIASTINHGVFLAERDRHRRRYDRSADRPGRHRTGAENDGQPQSFSWNISDAGSGLGSISVVIRQDGNIIYQTTDLADAIGSYGFAPAWGRSRSTSPRPMRTPTVATMR